MNEEEKPISLITNNRMKKEERIARVLSSGEMGKPINPFIALNLSHLTRRKNPGFSRTAYSLSKITALPAWLS